MRGVTPGRSVALAVLRAARRGQRADRALADLSGRLRSRERVWTHDLVYGTLRLRGRIDHLLDHHVDGGTAALSADVLEVLRLGAYQLLFMDSVPDYAAVSQTVTQAKRVAGPGAGGLTNAVLRSLAGAGEDRSLFPRPDGDPVGYLSTWGSHPRWLVERWLERWRFEEVETLVEANNRIPETCLLPLGIDVEQACARLKAIGAAAELVGWGTGSVRLSRDAKPRDVLNAVPGIIQDPSATLVVRYARPAVGSVIADLCAAPGGKALALARDARYVVAADRSASRLRLAKENWRRVSGPLGFVVANAAHPPLRPVDFVLLDAPCSGTGTLRRHPDAKWRLRPEDVPRLMQVQRALLDGAASAVAVGGVLVYATCTLEPEENEGQVEAFLEQHDEFSRDEPGEVPAQLLDPLGQLAALPQATGFDGAFAARLRRAGS